VVRDMASPWLPKSSGASVQTTQLLIEYDPQPLFDAGNLDKAPQPIVNAAREQLRKFGQ